MKRKPPETHSMGFVIRQHARPQNAGPRTLALGVVFAFTVLSWRAEAQFAQATYDPAGNVVSVSTITTSAPAISAEPQSQLLEANGTVVLSVTAAGGGLAYQWLSNGVPIPGASSDSLVLTNLVGINFATYSVIVSNASGAITSTPAAIWADSMGTGMPDWWQLKYFGDLDQPPDGDYDGDGVWNIDEFREGTNPADPTSYNPRLFFLLSPHGNIAASPAQPYYSLGQTVTLTAIPDSGQQFLAWGGSILGSKPVVSLVMDAHKLVTASFGLPLPVALDNTNLVWSTGGDAPWFGQTEVSQDGLGSAQSGTITYSQTSWLLTTANLSQPMQLGFWWDVSSQAPDGLSFSVDSTNLASIAGETVPWQEVQTNLPAGNHTLVWTYSKGAFNAPTGILFADAGWVEEVTLIPVASEAATPSAIVLAVNRGGGSIVLSWAATVGRTYQVQYKTALNEAFWAELTNVVAEGSFAVTTDLISADAQRYYRVVLLH